MLPVSATLYISTTVFNCVSIYFCRCLFPIFPIAFFLLFFGTFCSFSDVMYLFTILFILCFAFDFGGRVSMF